MTDNHETLMTSLATKGTIGGAGISLLGGITETELAAVSGLLVAVVGLGVNIFFQLRRDRREAELHEVQLLRVSPKDAP
jgi:hypothetical protein